MGLALVSFQALCGGGFLAGLLLGMEYAGY